MYFIIAILGNVITQEKMEPNLQPKALMDSNQTPGKGAAAVGPRWKDTWAARLVPQGHGRWPWSGTGI